jgi:hypothetical protein
MAREMLPQSYLNADLGLDSADRTTPPNPWQIISSVVTALAAIVSVITQWKGNRVLASILVAVALIAAVSVFYRLIAASVRMRIRNLRRNRISRRLWPEFLRFEKRFGTFLNKNDSTNLRYILSEICGRQEDEVAKFCAPDYLDDYYGLIRTRHLKKAARTETTFHFAMTELHQMVCSYNQDYVLNPLRRLKNNQVFEQLQPSARQSHEEKMKEFRERWVRFVDDFKEFIDKTNHDLQYDPRRAIGTYFEYPKTL